MQFYCLLPGEPARGEDKPLRYVGRGNLEREYVCARNVTHVDIHRYATNSAIVPGDGAIRCAADEPVDVTVRARCGRIVYLSRAQGPIDVRRMDRRHVEIWVSALEIAHGEICEALRDRVDEETGCAGLERVFGRQRVVCCRGEAYALQLLARPPRFSFLFEDSHFSVIVISFQKSSGEASDPILAVIMSCFTPAARPASRIRVVPETAV